ncbi:MAG: hypothetical protein HC880_09920 [Bacteroidia bacterium]|nr:hypothetical protein [Bacteroidia bacterium]
MPRIYCSNAQTFNGKPSFYLKLQGQRDRIPVSKGYYEQFPCGEIIQLEQSPHAKVLLSISSGES